MSPQLIDFPRYAWQLVSGLRAASEHDLAEDRKRDLEPYMDMTRSLRILDVANGRLRPQFSILSAEGHRVVGVDLANRPAASPVDLAYRAARPLYAWRLGVGPGSTRARALVCGDVSRLPFSDGLFDLVISAAAFEHFLDVPGVVADLYRVLRPGGMVWTSIHLFTSPSGGHNLRFTEIPLRRVPDGVDAWDHLRKRRLPFTVPLNEWRRDQYLATFGRFFEIVKHYGRSFEGEELLSAEIEAELAGYSRDELTCNAYVIVARKPS